MNTCNGANDVDRGSDHGGNPTLQRRLRSVDPSRIRADLFAATERELADLLAKILGDANEDESG